MVVLVGGRLCALAHGVRQKVAHPGVAAGAAVWGVDVVACKTFKLKLMYP